MPSSLQNNHTATDLWNLFIGTGLSLDQLTHSRTMAGSVSDVGSCKRIQQYHGTRMGSFSTSSIYDHEKTIVPKSECDTCFDRIFERDISMSELHRHLTMSIVFDIIQWRYQDITKLPYSPVWRKDAQVCEFLERVRAVAKTVSDASAYKKLSSEALKLDNHNEEAVIQGVSEAAKAVLGEKEQVNPYRIIALIVFIADLCRSWRLPETNERFMDRLLQSVMPLIWQKSTDWKAWMKEQKGSRFSKCVFKRLTIAGILVSLTLIYCRIRCM